MRILVVDDQSDVLDLVRAMLRRSDHDLICETEAPAALARLAVEEIDVFVTDIQMPVMDGFEAIRRARRANPDLWIVAMSAGGGAVATQTALTLSEALGADYILYKPFTRAEFLAAIARS